MLKNLDRPPWVSSVSCLVRGWGVVVEWRDGGYRKAV